jgi:hypothetical protein
MRALRLHRTPQRETERPPGAQRTTEAAAAMKRASEVRRIRTAAAAERKKAEGPHALQR